MKCHLIAIGGTGMGALAGLLRAAGHEVRGSDTGVYPPMSEQLTALHIPVFEGYSADNLSWGPDLVVVGNVISKGHPEAEAAQERGIETKSLPQLLGEQFLEDRFSLVVAGTHGKTTTTSMLAHILMEAARDPGCFIGGVPHNLGQGWRLGAGEEFVVEGDEYDSAYFDKGSKFLHYRPDAAILTSVELDHVDIFSSMEAVRQTFRKFVALIPEDGLLVVWADSDEALAVAREARCRIETYRVTGHDHNGHKEPTGDSEDKSIDWEVRQVEYLKTGRCRFELHLRGELFDRYETGMTGQHNLGNIAASVALAHLRGVSTDDIRRAISTFSGVRRRQEIRGMAQGVRIIDDYGHHPTSVAFTLQGLRRRYKGCRIVALYEPRSATSRRKTFQREYAEAFAHADHVVVGKLFNPKNIAKEDRFDPERLALDLHQSGTPATAIESVDGIVAHVVELVRPGDVVVVFSSGAFDGLHEKLLTSLGDAVIPARRDDMKHVRELLQQLDLDFRDLEDDNASKILCLLNESGVVGCVGLEAFGDDAVLRSLAVRPGSRGVGYGWMLADSAISRARRQGVRRLYLVTENASDFFAAKHGFRVVDLSTVSSEVANSVTFRSPRGRASVAMRLDL